MSCLSLPKSEAAGEERFEAEEIRWPAIVQGIRVYARGQPPKTASELLEWAELFEGIAQLREEEPPR